MDIQLFFFIILNFIISSDAARCRQKLALENGNLYLMGSFVVPLCNEGYKLIGPSSKRCLGGKWTPIEDSFCLPIIECTVPDSIKYRIRIAIPDSGLSEDDKFVEGTAVYITCRNSVEADEEGFLTVCTNEGSWNDTSFVTACAEKPEPVYCEPLPINKLAIDDLDIAKNHTPGAKVEFSCRPPLYNAGGSFLTCQQNASWDVEVIDCRVPAVPEPIICDPLPLEITVQLTDVNKIFSPGDQVWFTCGPSLYNAGNHFLKCLDNGTWDLESVDCRPQASFSTCALCDLELPHIPNGHLGLVNGTNQKLEIFCHPRYQIIEGTKYIEYLPGGKWSVDFGLCERLICDPLPFVENVNFIPLDESNKYEIYSYMKIECSDGMVNVGKEYMRCRADGSWDIPHIACQKIVDQDTTCERPNPIENGVIAAKASLNTFKVDTTIQYECHLGYRLVGEVSRTCSKNGWSGEPPICELIQCMAPGTRTRGPTTKLFNPGELIRVKCPPGQKVIGGSDLLLCLSDGNWNNTIPKCQAVFCKSPEIPRHGYITSVEDRSKAYPLGSIVNYHCQPEYRLEGGRVSKCTDKGWSEPAPACLDVIECGIVPHLPSEKSTMITWPWMVIIHYENPVLNRTLAICSGSLLSQNWVLTSASCFPEYFRDYGRISTEIGMINVQRSYVKSVRKFRSKTTKGHYDDLALVELRDPVTFGPFVSPICLPEGLDDGREDGSASFITWKTEKNLTMTSSHLELVIEKESLCHEELEEDSSNRAENVFCVGEGEDSGIPDVCGADLGGPLLTQESHLDGQSFWVQKGLLVNPENCLLDTTYGYFQDIRSSLPAIRDVLSKKRNENNFV